MHDKKPYASTMTCPLCGSRCTDPRPYAPSFECGGPNSIECKRRQQDAHDRMCHSYAAPAGEPEQPTCTCPPPYERQREHVAGCPMDAVEPEQAACDCTYFVWSGKHSPACPAWNPAPAVEPEQPTPCDICEVPQVRGRWTVEVGDYGVEHGAEFICEACDTATDDAGVQHSTTNHGRCPRCGGPTDHKPHGEACRQNEWFRAGWDHATSEAARIIRAYRAEAERGSAPVAVAVCDDLLEAIRGGDDA